MPFARLTAVPFVCALALTGLAPTAAAGAIPKTPVHTSRSAAKPVTAHAAKPVNKPVVKKPVAKPVNKPVVKKPGKKPVAKPVNKPVVKKPGKKPVAKPVAPTPPLVHRPSPAAGQLVHLAPDSPFYSSVRRAPVAPNSAASIALLAKQVNDHWGGTAAVNAYSYNTSIVRVKPSQKRIRVGFHDCQRKGYQPQGLYDGAKHFVDVPVPNDAIPAAGTDAALALYDPSTDQAWEFWQMRKTRAGGWEACWGGRLDGVSTSREGTFPYPYGASASGIITAAGAISIDEARRGKITHALNLGIIGTAKHNRVSWPANRSDGGTQDVNALQIGQRIRLDPRVNVESLKLSPFAKMVARAAQEYGLIVTESSGAVAISTESGAIEQARTGVNPWPKLIGGEAYSALDDFPWDRMQSLPIDYGKN